MTILGSRANLCSRARRRSRIGWSSLVQYRARCRRPIFLGHWCCSVGGFRLRGVNGLHRPLFFEIWNRSGGRRFVASDHEQRCAQREREQWCRRTRCCGLAKHYIAKIIVLDTQAQRMRFGVAYQRHRIPGRHFCKRNNLVIARSAVSPLLAARHRVPVLLTRTGNVKTERMHV